MRLPLSLSLLVLASCANMEQTRTGFLGDYESLEPAPERQVWGVPDEILLDTAASFEERAASESIRLVMVDPVVYRPIPEPRYRMSDEAARSIEAWSTERLRSTLSKDFEVIDEPAPGAVRVRMAITDVNPSNVWINIIGVILVVPPDMGGLSGEMELVDAMSGERLAAMTATREGTPFLLFECFTKHGHARHGVKKWARDLSRLMRGE